LSSRLGSGEPDISDAERPRRLARPTISFLLPSPTWNYEIRLIAVWNRELPNFLRRSAYSVRVLKSPPLMGMKVAGICLSQPSSGDFFP